jgi:hypothetical protein
MGRQAWASGWFVWETCVAIDGVRTHLSDALVRFFLSTLSPACLFHFFRDLSGTLRNPREEFAQQPVHNVAVC